MNNEPIQDEPFFELDNSNDKKYADYLDEVSGNNLTADQKDEIIKLVKTQCHNVLNQLYKAEKPNE